MKIIATILCLFAITANAQNVLLNSKDLKSFIGNWNGRFEFVDYKDDKSVTVLQTKLDIKGAGDSLIMQYSITEPGGKIVKQRESWKIVSNGEQLQDDKEIADISDVIRDQNTITITLDRKGADNNNPSMIRKTITLSGNSLVISKRVKYDAGGDYFLRHQYTFRKS
ncbi:MAG TPA: hypothetical protein VK498_01110 [Ferruginibacter sp.]|nr:hypothetical protein [Ferruginibacter sp.]